MTKEVEELEKVGLREETVDINFTGKLVKHLAENEVICDTCGGLGLTKTDNPFGIQGYKHPSRVMFPFKNQDLTFCPSCYNGVRKKCDFCGNLLSRGSSECKCRGYKENKQNEREKKALETWEKAEKIPLEQALKIFKQFYVHNHSDFISANSFKEWLEESKKYNKSFDIETLRVYGTTEHSLSIDICSVVEDAADELHEEALSGISSEKMSELQGLVDKWCTEVENGTVTYYMDETKGILLT